MKSKKRALGRGLDAILQSPDTDITSKDISGNYVAGAIAEIDINQIQANPFQPRTKFDQESLDELMQSIQEQGIIQPITVRKLGYGKYQLISGERRLRAAVQIGMTKIPTFIRVANDEQMLEMALIENIHREDLNAIEIAISYQRLTEECQLTQEQLSEKVGKNRATVANYMRLLKLPAEIQVALRNNTITMGHARALINIVDPSDQVSVLQQIIGKDLSVRAVEKLARQLINKTTAVTTNITKPLPDHIVSGQNTLEKMLDAQVKVSRNTKGKGTIVIPFESDQDFKKILSKLT